MWVCFCGKERQRRQRGDAMNIDVYLNAVKAWAAQQTDIAAVLLVGSHARGTARADSDVDLVILTTHPSRYLDSAAYAETFGPVARWTTENWGRVTSMRVWYRDGLEVEYGITRPDWAAEPLDAGTRQVISGGVRIIFDRNGSLEIALL